MATQLTDDIIREAYKKIGNTSIPFEIFKASAHIGEFLSRISEAAKQGAESYTLDFEDLTYISEANNLIKSYQINTKI